MTRPERRGPADWICLAATPCFAAMALLTAVSGAPDVICSSGGSIPGAGMASMYVLMSLFHAAPWLKLTGRPGSD